MTEHGEAVETPDQTLGAKKVISIKIPKPTVKYIQNPNSAMNKKGLITGINGQNGSYLAEFFIEKGYEVHGIIRRSSSFNTAQIEHLYIEQLIGDSALVLPGHFTTTRHYSSDTRPPVPWTSPQKKNS